MKLYLLPFKKIYVWAPKLQFHILLYYKISFDFFYFFQPFIHFRDISKRQHTKFL